jgi:glutamate synthase domain-containing protein 2/nitrite reductase/ring-hydroxylating ferredoxin subunit
MDRVKVATFSELTDREPAGALVGNTDLVIVRYGDEASVLYGRCPHRGALMADGHIEGGNLICGVHRWDFRVDTGVSQSDSDDTLHKFSSCVTDGAVWVDADEIAEWEEENPQPFKRDEYQGAYQDPEGTSAEPFVDDIRELATNGLEGVGHHGPLSAMGVRRDELPTWDDLQLVTAQLHRLPLLDDAPVDTELVVGPRADRPLRMDIPIFVSDMSFGALSQEAKTALAKGAEMAGTGICSGEGGVLPEEQAENTRYLYELASARFGFEMALLKDVQAFHFKGGQGAKTGVGGHLPGEKVHGKIAQVRGLPEGQSAISPATFPDWTGLDDFRRFADEVRGYTGGIPIGFKLSAQHVEADVQAAVDIGVDYIILDGRGGGTGAAPDTLKEHISVPTMPAIARARRHLDEGGHDHVTLIATGGLRTAPDFAKAMALGADGVAVANSALQAIGCIGMRACHTNNCPVGIATQKGHLRARLMVDQAAERLDRFLRATVDLMRLLSRACGHARMTEFSADDLTTWKRDVAYLTGVRYGGVTPL